MNALEIIRLILLITHFIGLAAIIGPFILQMRTKTGLKFRTMLVGAIVQVVTGAALIGVRKAEDLPVIDEKMLVKLLVALAVLAAVIVAIVRQRRLVAAGQSDRPVLPFLHTAGFLAIANVVVAVVWT